jgi:hypothetical protein
LNRSRFDTMDVAMDLKPLLAAGMSDVWSCRETSLGFKLLDKPVLAAECR